MDLFKSVFSTDPEESPSADDDESPNLSSTSSSGAGWSFGGLIKTIATRSESVIETYRRDLEEFGSGLRKETAVVREAAARVVRDLPGSLEAGASAAQDSLESVGQAIDDLGGSVWRGTADILSHSREAILSLDSPDAAADATATASKRYSRFEALLMAAQSDPNTFAEDPEDKEDFEDWKAGFELPEKEEEIEVLLYDNGALEGLFEKMVPSVVDYDTFWSRYYYRVYKLKQAEDARANLVKRAISTEEEEELSWEVDDEEEDEQKEKIVEVNREEKEQKPMEESETEKDENLMEKEDVQTSEPVEEKRPQVDKLEDPAMSAPVPMPLPQDQVQGAVEKLEDGRSNGDELAAKSDDKVMPEAKAETLESNKDADIPVVLSKATVLEEDDLGWDEIEDLGEHDDKKLGGTGVSPNLAELHKRLSTADEDEDLSWDIEDDEEPAKH